MHIDVDIKDGKGIDLVKDLWEGIKDENDDKEREM